MAAEASRSSLAADSYIGSLISIISKSKIRYEGSLFTVNATESSIGLQNVQSFGTEGRKLDSEQFPPSDKVYEYILFRGSDIKDLQVKSSPPVQTTTPIYNDPTIIQFHYPQEAATSTSLPFTETRSQRDLNSYIAQVGCFKLVPQSSVPLYQPSGSSGSWVSLHPSPATNNNSLPLPMYLQGFYAASDRLQTQQQSSLRPPPELLMPPSMQQSMQYPTMSASLPSRAFNLPALPFLDTPPPLLPSFSASSLNMHSSLLPAESSAVPSNSSTTSMSNKAPIQAPAALNTSLPLVTVTTTVLDKNAFATTGAVQPKIADSMMSYGSSVLESEHLVAGTSIPLLNKGLALSLVTPNQFLRPGPSLVSSSQSSQSVQKDVEVVQVSSTEKPLQTLPKAQAPLLPLSTPLDYKIMKVHGDHSHTHHNNRGGRGRARGHWASQNVTSFTEDFDFIAMNEKFNKDEVWGHLGKTDTALEDGCFQDEDDAGTSNFETKDDFFDSLSSNASGGSHNGRTRFSEQMKLDTETFGNFARHRGGHGGRVFGRSGRGSDRVVYGYGHGGRGFGDGGRSRGVHSGSAHYGRSYAYNERGGWGHHAT